MEALRAVARARLRPMLSIAGEKLAVANWAETKKKDIRDEREGEVMDEFEVNAQGTRSSSPAGRSKVGS